MRARDDLTLALLVGELQYVGHEILGKCKGGPTLGICPLWILPSRVSYGILSVAFLFLSTYLDYFAAIVDMTSID